MASDKIFKEFLADIGAKLAELREQKGYGTIREFVAKYDLPEIQYWRIEKGKANITVKSLVKILLIHKLTPKDFFDMLHQDKRLSAPIVSKKKTKKLVSKHS